MTARHANLAAVKLYDPTVEAAVAAPVEPPKPKRRLPRIRRGQWTLVAKGIGGRGVRFMFEAKTMAEAMNRGRAICRQNRFDFVHVFPGRMAALRYA